MKWLLLTAVVALFCCPPGIADTARHPAQERSSADRGYQDIVYFGETRPILLRLQIGVAGRPLSAVWDDFITKVFKHLDTNGDGVLDRNEAQRLPPPGVLFGGANGPEGGM